MDTNINNPTQKSWISGKHTRAGIFSQKPSKKITDNPLADVKKVGVGNLYLTNDGLYYQEQLLDPLDIRSVRLINFPGMPPSVSMKTLEITFIADPEILLIVDTDMSPKALQSENIQELHRKLQPLVPPENLTKKMPISKPKIKKEASKLRKMIGFIAVVLIVLFVLNNFLSVLIS